MEGSKLNCRLLLIAVAVAATHTSPVVAQTGRVGSALQFAGRFMGYGYTKGGYHAPANQQLHFVRNHHPAHRYASSGLMYPYSPHYQPQRPHIPAYGLPMQHYAQQGVPQAMQSEPVQAPEPVGPPPEWLKQYLDKNKETAAEDLPPRLPDRVGDPVEPVEPEEVPSTELGSPYDFDMDLGSEDLSPSDREATSQAEALLEASGLDESDLEEGLLDTDGLLEDSDLDSLDGLDGGDSDDDLLLLDEITQRVRPSTGGRLQLTPNTATARARTIRVQPKKQAPTQRVQVTLPPPKPLPTQPQGRVVNRYRTQPVPLRPVSSILQR